MSVGYVISCMRSYWQNVFIAGLLLFPAGLFAEKLRGRYIIELNTESVAEHVLHSSPLKGRAAMRTAAADTHRTRIRGEQQQLRGRLQEKQATVLGSVDTVAN